jgi:ligand-binding sensor domain-containing protein
MIRMLLRLLFIVVLFEVCNKGFSQSYEEKDFTRYTKLDGLSNNHVLGIIQDSSGYIWIGTNKGLNRFDGKFFLNFFKNSKNSPIPENSIYSLHVQNADEIIGATNAGAFSFDPITRQYKYFIVPVDSIMFFWANQSWQTLQDKKGNYIVSTKTGLYVFDSTGKVVCRYDHYAASDAGRKELWFGNWLYPLTNGTIFQSNSLLGSLYNSSTNNVDTFFAAKRQELRQFLTDGNGESRIYFPGLKNEILIANSDDNSIGAYDLLTGNYWTSPVAAGILSDIDWFSKLQFINDSSLVITSKVGGFYVLRYDKLRKKISGDGKKYFAAKYCTCVFNDREGRLWVGTNDGLYKQNLRNSFFSAEDLSTQLPSILNTGIQSIYMDKGKIFIGLRNEGGLLVLDKKTKKILRHIHFRDSSRSNTINFIFSYHPDTLWIGTAEGVVWLNKNNYSNGRLHKPGQPRWMNQTRTRNFLEDSGGNIWLSFGELNSVVVFDRRKHEFIDFSKSPLLRITFCFSMAEDKQGNVWLAGDGLCRWNVKKKLIDTLIPYPTVGKSLFNYMQILDRDENNNLWIASYDNEIIQYNCTDNRMYLRLPVNSLIDGYTVTNSPIINNNIWMGMTNGISAFNIKNYGVTQFNYADGLPSATATSIRKGSFYDANENRFYFGAGQYLISFTPDPELSRKPLPQFSIEVTDRNNRPITIGVPLSYSQNAVQLRFNVINFTDPEENRFSYRTLDKEDSNWHELQNQNGVLLSEVPPGDHSVQVKLYSVNNRWPEQIKTLSIVIKPPFWKTSLFIIVVVLVAVTFIYVFYRGRIKKINQKANLDKLVAQTEMKALHAQMNPHFIFNCLNSIKEMILSNENQQASHYLSKFAYLIRVTLNNSSKPFISLQNTIDYLKRYLEMEQIRKSNFSYEIEVDESVPTEDVFLPPMLIQPFIENAIWHGPSGVNKPVELNIRFLTGKNELVCIVEDNGIGIQASLKNKYEQREVQDDHASLGIANVKQRIHVLNEKYNLHSRVTIEDKQTIPGCEKSGTLVTLYLPMKIEDL